MQLHCTENKWKRRKRKCIGCCACRVYVRHIVRSWFVFLAFNSNYINTHHFGMNFICAIENWYQFFCYQAKRSFHSDHHISLGILLIVHYSMNATSFLDMKAKWVFGNIHSNFIAFGTKHNIFKEFLITYWKRRIPRKKKCVKKSVNQLIRENSATTSRVIWLYVLVFNMKQSLK